MSQVQAPSDLSESQIEDLRLAAKHLAGVKRRAFQAEITLKYCNGSARLAENQFGWSRRTVSVGLGEKRTGVICQGAQSDDHDMGVKETYIPCSIVDEDTDELFISFGSSYKTSDFIVDTLQAWWAKLTPQGKRHIPMLQIKVDNGPENSGVRAQFLKRLVDWVNQIGKPVKLL